MLRDTETGLRDERLSWRALVFRKVLGFYDNVSTGVIELDSDLFRALIQFSKPSDKGWKNEGYTGAYIDITNYGLGREILPRTGRYPGMYDLDADSPPQKKLCFVKRS